MKAYYDDGINCFDCIALACHINGNMMLIKDLDSGDTGWCSAHLIQE